MLENRVRIISGKFLLRIWPLFFPILVLVAYIARVNNHFSRHADHVTARYWDKRLHLIGIQLLAQATVMSITFDYIWFFWWGVPQTNKYMLAMWWFVIVCGPVVVVWSIHLIRHASWRFAHWDDYFGGN